MSLDSIFYSVFVTLISTNTFFNHANIFLGSVKTHSRHPSQDFISKSFSLESRKSSLPESSGAQPVKDDPVNAKAEAVRVEAGNAALEEPAAVDVEEATLKVVGVAIEDREEAVERGSVPLSAGSKTTEEESSGNPLTATVPDQLPSTSPSITEAGSQTKDHQQSEIQGPASSHGPATSPAPPASSQGPATSPAPPASSSLTDLQLGNLVLSSDSPKKKRITREDFLNPSGNLQSNVDPSDPLSQLNPLWSLK